MHTQRAYAIGLLALGIIVATAPGIAGSARAATTTVGRAATWPSDGVGANGIGNGASSHATQDYMHQLPENPSMRPWR